MAKKNSLNEIHNRIDGGVRATSYRPHVTHPDLAEHMEKIRKLQTRSVPLRRSLERNVLGEAWTGRRIGRTEEARIFNQVGFSVQCAPDGLEECLKDRLMVLSMDIRDVFSSWRNDREGWRWPRALT